MSKNIISHDALRAAFAMCYLILHETFYMPVFSLIHGFMVLLLLEKISTTHHVLDRYVLQTFTLLLGQFYVVNCGLLKRTKVTFD